MDTISGQRLLLVATAPVNGRDDFIHLDKKFVEGMQLHREMWPGPIHCILRRSNAPIPFGALYKLDDLGFELTVLESRERLSVKHLKGIDIVLCSADVHDFLHVPALAGAQGIPVVYTIEYTLDARLRIVAMDKTLSAPRRAYSMLWTVWQESRRRRALRRAYGVQANGYPAAQAYRKLNRNMIMYLDNRLKPGMFATEAEMEHKAARLKSDAPLRLIHSGRLEAMKGAQDLVPVAAALHRQGINFSLSIYGDGSLREEIMQGIRRCGLTQVNLHAPVDFATGLVPVSRTDADIFLSCHRQSDPSCTYLESLGCGVPIAGYDNPMWAAMLKESGGGWSVPLGDIETLAAKIAHLSVHREEIMPRAKAGLQFAHTRDFVTEFWRRMDHMQHARRDTEFRPGGILRA